MTEVPEEALVPDEPDDEPDPEEYESEGDAGGMSGETGTVYEGEGEPALTPHDADPADDDE
jgi:hypothetical protein